MNKHKRCDLFWQAACSAVLADMCYEFLKPLLVELNTWLDRRLVQTCLGLVLAIVMHRHRNQGLLLSELGSYLLSPDRGPAGTKRLSRLLHSPRWEAELVEDFLWQGADRRVEELVAEKKIALAIWDESVLEKAESLHLEGLGPVRSTKAARLKRIKPGYYNPPGGRPIFVPGMNSLAVLVMGPSGPPTLASMQWWTTRGPQATDRRSVERALLADLSQRWGPDVVHVWDRGFAGSPWLTSAFVHAARFILRWPKRYQLRDEQGQLRPAWQFTRGRRSWGHRYLYDARRRCQRKVGVVAVPVYDQTYNQPLWLVVARPGQGREPWYLLTTEPILTLEDAWAIVFAYARRWQVEMAWRFTKSELAFECPRLRDWPARHKFLLIVTLVYAFLLSLLKPAFHSLCQALLAAGCHRTGKRSRETSAPLYRLRIALGRLWLAHPPPFLARLNSG
jgi:hypothetical protein